MPRRRKPHAKNAKHAKSKLFPLQESLTQRRRGIISSRKGAIFHDAGDHDRELLIRGPSGTVASGDRVPPALSCPKFYDLVPPAL